MKRALEAFGVTVAQTYLAALVITVYIFPAIFVFAIWALLGYILGFIIDSLELSRALGRSALVGLFVIGFGVALFFAVYVWPRVRESIGKVMDQLGEASKTVSLLMLAVVLPLAATMTAAAAQCQCDEVALQRHVEKYNELAHRCERAAWEEKDYLMRLWHWKACMWDNDAPRFGDQIERAIKLGIYDPRLQ